MRWAILPFVLLFSVSCSAAGSDLKFESANLDSPHHLAEGKSEGKVTLSGRLRFPEGEGQTEGQFPVVIFVHGSGGPLPRHERVWLSHFRDLGFATFQFNAFAPRGVISTVGNQEAVTAYSMVRDVFAAKEMLARLPGIDAGRIGIMGSSKGGVVALLSSKRLWQRAWNAELAFHIALYPFCRTYETYDIDAPVLVLSGKKDEWVGYEACQGMVAEMRAAGVDADFKLYDAYHGWDSPNSVGLIRRADGYANCRFKLLDDGTHVNLRTGKAVPRRAELDESVADCRVSGGQYIGRDDAAREASVADVSAFLSQFK